MVPWLLLLSPLCLSLRPSAEAHSGSKIVESVAATLDARPAHARPNASSEGTLDARPMHAHPNASASEDDEGEEPKLNFTEVDYVLVKIHSTVDELKAAPALVQNSTALQRVLKDTRAHLLQLDAALDDGEKAELMKQQAHVRVGSLLAMLKGELAAVTELKQSAEAARMLSTVRTDLGHVEGLETALSAAEARATTAVAGPASAEARAVEELKEQIEDALPALASSVHEFTQRLQARPELGQMAAVKAVVASAQNIVHWIERHPTLRARFALATAEASAAEAETQLDKASHRYADGPNATTNKQ